MILAGALIPLAALQVMIVLLVAIITVHLPNGFSSMDTLKRLTPLGLTSGQPGYETDLVFPASLLALCFGGPGPLSVYSSLNRFIRENRLFSLRRLGGS